MERWKAADGECLGPRDSQKQQQQPGKGQDWLRKEGQQQVPAERCSGSPWYSQTATVLIAKSHVSYDMLHGLIPHTLGTAMMAFSELCICKNRKQTFCSFRAE